MRRLSTIGKLNEDHDNVKNVENKIVDGQHHNIQIFI